jgi:diguanylate cyclase (GGDEF)-like protein
LHEHVRESDVAGRYGGEEFGVVLSDTDSAGGQIFAERLRKAVEASLVQYNGQDIRFTVSLGVADLSQPANDHAELIARADQALYTSKKTGRNRVTVHGH